MINYFWKRIKYRFRQFLSVINPKVDPIILQEIKKLIPKEWCKYFDRLLPSEKAHVIRLYKKILSTENISVEEKRELLILAIVHDFGKALLRPTLFERIAKTLLPIPNQAHAILGAKILRKLGASNKLCFRVAKHHKAEHNDKLLKLFQKFDDSH